jgi:hypothetical protein
MYGFVQRCLGVVASQVPNFVRTVVFDVTKFLHGETASVCLMIGVVQRGKILRKHESHIHTV